MTTLDWSGVLLTAAALATIGLVISYLVRRRRRSSSSSAEAAGPKPTAAPPIISDTVRMLITAGSEADVAEVAVTKAVALTHADGGVLMRPDTDGLRPAGHRYIVVGSAVNEVLVTGEPLLTTLHHDPLWPDSVSPALAVPVTTAANAQGVIVLWRAGGPFSPADAASVAALAPSVALALTNADRLGDAQQLALVDQLTQLGNRRRLDHDLHDALESARVGDIAVAFAMIDVDHFKAFNDQNGHTVGDDALRIVANTLAANVRDTDIVYRYGGEEFCVLLPGATPEDARYVAHRVRHAVEAQHVPGEETQPTGRLTVSVGVSHLGTSAPTALKRHADEALYRAKASGRNRVVIA